MYKNLKFYNNKNGSNTEIITDLYIKVQLISDFQGFLAEWDSELDARLS